ncbi:diguanylate cyclase (GGDEF) domain-containing protein [Desulfacinum hydrothermale DSM 13146]|uniref:Diguanylate cyclase (GGDEF) domain-containing protein n=1 Tax=Desulfacinum hydrothermale DSM 13146 TaxID=1121390 RepID=A0A1W1X7P7_9BACT|nr:sensor domain-containing diguanylate cyclase [Desulfacinum hydrothermale]SMC19992.1 diguanylate cyclase (GGDEF) domain-containing protein [Desulfacinum hydrothermale DSM 13146]
MYDIDLILQNAKRNEEIARKLFDVEVCILSITNFQDLLERLLHLIQTKFQIPYVWLSLVKSRLFAPALDPSIQSPRLKHRLNLTTRENLVKVLDPEGTPVLANDALRRFYGLFPDQQAYAIGSIAVAPLTLDGHIIGTLNLADVDPQRFQPDMDTFFLSQLAVKVSICFSNVISREKLNYLATRDPLTGLPNRRELELRLQRECKRSSRYGTPLALVFVDCDDFKGINDQYGHDAGDAFLKHVAATLRNSLREEDMVARFAGDEFVLVLPNQHKEEARRVMERLAQTLASRPLAYEDHQIWGSLSFGIAVDRAGKKTPAALLREADEALYEHKKSKRDRNEASSWQTAVTEDREEPGCKTP